MSNHPIVHVEIPANDPKAAGQFYGNLFGWNIQSDSSAGMEYTMFSAEGGPGGGFPRAGGGSDGDPMSYQPGQVLVYVGTDDIEGTLSKVESLGGKVVAPKFEIPHVGWMAIFTDPTGNRVALFTASTPQQS